LEKTAGQSKIANREKLANKTQYVLDSTLRKQIQIT